LLLVAVLLLHALLPLTRLHIGFLGLQARESALAQPVTHDDDGSTHPHAELPTHLLLSQVYEHFHGRPGWKVVTKTMDYAGDYASSKFCLAAPGGGWGKRGIVAAM
jgi:hypothetical protein